MICFPLLWPAQHRMAQHYMPQHCMAQHVVQTSDNCQLQSLQWAIFWLAKSVDGTAVPAIVCKQAFAQAGENKI